MLKLATVYCAGTVSFKARVIQAIHGSFASTLRAQDVGPTEY